MFHPPLDQTILSNAAESPRYARCGESEESRGEEESTPPFLWGRVIDKRARPEGPLVRQPRRRKKRWICKIQNPQAPARRAKHDCTAHPVCALTLADLGSCRSDAFFACAAGGQEDPRAGPSCQSPGPKGEEGEPSPPLDSTLLRGVRTLAIMKRCSMGFGPTADGTSSISPIVC